jgi:hypothetical protein
MSIDSPVGLLNNDSSSAAEFALGTIIKADDGRKMLYVLAADDFDKGDFVAIDENFAIRPLIKTRADARQMIGCCADFDVTDEEYTFVTISGVFEGNIIKDAAADSAFYTSGTTSGYLDDDSSGQKEIFGVVNTAKGADGVPTPCIAACRMHA